LGWIGTLQIYQVLFKYIKTHNRIMLSTKIISYDTFQHRRNVNLFTMAGQLVTFLVELFFYVSMSFILILAEDSHLPRAMFIVGYVRCQFHQCFTRKFFIRTLFRLLFSSYMYIVKAARSTFVQKTRAYDVDEIDVRMVQSAFFD